MPSLNTRSAAELFAELTGEPLPGLRIRTRNLQLAGLLPRDSRLRESDMDDYELGTFLLGMVASERHADVVERTRALCALVPSSSDLPAPFTHTALLPMVARLLRLARAGSTVCAVGAGLDDGTATVAVGTAAADSGTGFIIYGQPHRDTWPVPLGRSRTIAPAVFAAMAAGSVEAVPAALRHLLPGHPKPGASATAA